MKRMLLMLLALVLLATGLCPALAEEAAGANIAVDLTQRVLINNREYNKYAPDDSRDNDYTTYYSGQGMTITAPEGEVIGSVLLKWRTISSSQAIVKTQVDGQWVEVMRDGPNYAAQYIVLPELLNNIRITTASGMVELCEVTVLGPGQAPSYVQVWRDAPEKVDLILFSTHPDDEVLWFGGLLPYYAGEMGKDVLVVNAVYGWYYRRQELLAALWDCGVDIYPILLAYPDNSDSVQSVYNAWYLKEKECALEDKIVSIIRKYKPDVVVLHDVDGEYGHPAHVLFSQLGQQGVERAADPDEHTASVEACGVWDVPKTYIHLWAENQIQMDWKQPLSAFDGMTGLEVADKAMQNHKTQIGRGWAVTEGGEYDNSLFGLWRTIVGPDVAGGDMFENIRGE